MSKYVWSVALVLSVLGSGPADAEIIKGVMAIKGAEMP